MTAPVEPGTPVTVVLTGTYEGSYGTDAVPVEIHFVRTGGDVYSVPADALILPAAGPDPVVLTPAIRSAVHRAARALPDTATAGQSVEAALSALEPVVAALLVQARADEREKIAQDVAALIHEDPQTGSEVVRAGDVIAVVEQLYPGFYGARAALDREPT